MTDSNDLWSSFSLKEESDIPQSDSLGRFPYWLANRRNPLKAEE